MKRKILIEPLLFDDYYIAVYDEYDSLLLDKKYFTAGLNSAIMTARALARKPSYKDLPIFYATCDADLTEITLEQLLKNVGAVEYKPV